MGGSIQVNGAEVNDAGTGADGCAIWITGLPGSGKTTIAEKVAGSLGAKHLQLDRVNCICVACVHGVPARGLRGLCGHRCDREQTRVPRSCTETDPAVCRGLCRVPDRGVHGTGAGQGRRICASQNICGRGKRRNRAGRGYRVRGAVTPGGRGAE